LSQIFRQQEGSRIVLNAHRILAGNMPEVNTQGSELSDFYFIENNDSEACLETLIRLVRERIPHAFGLDPVRDVQVLCPMYRGPLGVDSINEKLGGVLVRGGSTLVRGTRRFRPGDKVLQIRNNYDLELFNGDPGRVRRVDVEGRKLRIEFLEREVELAGEDIDQFVPAYGITVHRAQGSEYPAVVLTLDPSHFLLQNRRLLYTAVTRAKRLMVLVGSRRALERAVETDEEGQRVTGLRERLAQFAGF
jgi:exodeoxyribonuclease V alpha subunit